MGIGRRADVGQVRVVRGVERGAQVAGLEEAGI